jgi:hypothetical protein
MSKKKPLGHIICNGTVVADILDWEMRSLRRDGRGKLRAKVLLTEQPLEDSRFLRADLGVALETPIEDQPQTVVAGTCDRCENFQTRGDPPAVRASELCRACLEADTPIHFRPKAQRADPLPPGVTPEMAAEAARRPSDDEDACSRCNHQFVPKQEEPCRDCHPLPGWPHWEAVSLDVLADDLAAEVDSERGSPEA